MAGHRNSNMSKAFKWTMTLTVLGALMLSMGSPAVAENYPTKPIVLIVPYSPGGGTDVAARVMAKYVEPYLGQPIVVENKAGAGGQVGWSAFAKAKPDGYTIGFVNSPAILLVKALRENVPFQISDFRPIANIQIDPGVIVVHPDSPLKTMNDFIAHAKKNPGKLNLGGDGPQSNYHLQAVVMEKALGIKTNFVSYSGSGPAVTAILGNQVDAVISSISSAAQHIEAKRLRALALIDTEKFASLPDLPLIKDVAGVDISPIGASMRGIAVPKGVAEDKVKFLEEAFAKLMKDPQFLEKGKEMGVPLKYMNGKQFSEALARDEKELVEYVNLLKN